MIYLKLFLAAFLVLSVCIFLLLFFTSLIEQRIKVVAKSLVLIPAIVCLSALLLLPANFNWILIIIDILLLLTTTYIFLPKFLFPTIEEDKATGNIDERTIMFARKELKPGSERFNEYYKEYPSHKDNDDKFRSMAGLLGEQSKFYNSLSYNAADAIFSIVDGLHPFVNGEVKDKPVDINPKQFSQFIKHWSKKSGVASIAFTKMKNYHWYSVGGRGERYNRPIEQEHKIGIAFTVEMDHEMVASAPKGSIIMESATQYLKAGIIATQLAQFIRNCGFDARAHIDGNYEVVAPLVARDANLGEIGRMGLLMTPEFGPRVRVGVITTNMPLLVEERQYDNSYEDFCEKCLKCAVNCPASAIPDSDKKIINNVNRWQINSEKCFNYWCMAGTDCGRCMSTCPYSHPNNLMHNIIRWSIRQFPNFRYWAVKMDDFFYGRKTAPAKLPNWIETTS
ncbi:reductive dehalogenase domain-containing protein [Carboxylicivirga marina]|uniref:4Fe-4S ferredoxin-type domain-containing protein n=1 Tax=Carboxylicivirga marina TaxID=2800988 RepID=A0ABS1HQB6_9BACT|nr:reductive dehalogenase domain-containing protein [Carboxylicivirga marina]MBK3519878.1 hypothetical protein [Carboxylicivirga marina]